MSGIKFVLNQNFQYGIELNENDQRLNAGSLILLEPARDGNDGTIPSSLVNYAEASALALSGQSIPTVAVRNTLADVGGIAERTAKGGLHGIYPQNLTSAMPRGVLSGVLPDAINDYCLANPDHDFYISMLGRITRNSLTNQDNYTLAGLRATSNPISTPIVPVLYQASSSGNVAGGRQQEFMLGRASSSSPLQPWLIDVAHSVFTPQTSSNTNSISYELFTIGSHSNASVIAGQPSWVMYSLYLEDLTVSGQTYEQAHAKSQEVFNSRFSAGGIYAGDTWTPPA